MPGRLRTNFRSGNLAEHLGLLMLKSIAAVADVPRTEDIGLDAIATLLRPDADGNCYAEDTFVVQFKSAAETSMEYRGHQLTWFLTQSQPMFIALVSRKDTSISLYPTLRVNQAVLALDAELITMLFCEPESSIPWAGGPENSATVWLGPPLLAWALTEMDDAEFATSVYDTLKLFLAIARREHELLSLGQSSTIVWSTNNKDSIQSSFGMMKGNREIRRVANQCLPHLTALMMQAMMMPDGSGSGLMTFLIGLAGSLHDLGVDINAPTDALAKMFLLTRVGAESEAGNAKMPA